MLELLSNTRNRVIKTGLILCLSLVFSIFICNGWHAPAEADAAVTALDAWPATPQINNVTTSPATTTFTPSAGSNRLIVIEVTNIPNNTTVTTISVTYGSNNVPATYVVDSANNQRRQAWLFYLTEADIASATGNTITVTNNNAVNFSVNIATFSGGDQTTPVTASGGQYINNTSPTLNYPAALNVNAGGYGIIAAGCNTTGGTIGESYTDHGETTVGAGFSRLGSLAFAGAGTTNPGITYGANVRGGVVGLTLNPTAGSPGTLQLSSSTYSVNENAGTVTITVTRAGGSSGAASVQYATSDGSANQPGDYTATSGTLNWADGDSADKTFTVTIIDDAAVESSETVNLTLSNATGASMGTPSTATVTISDNDVAGSGTVQLNSSGYSVDEAAGTITITVTRTGGSSGTASVNYTTSNDTAMAGSDYTSISGTLNWADGDSADKTFAVTISNDSTAENNETFNIELSGATGASMGTPSSSVVTIPFNDGFVPPPAVPAGNTMLFGILFIGISVYGLMKGRKKEV